MKIEDNEVADIINREFGSNVANLSKAKQLHEAVLVQKKELEKKLYSTSEEVTEGVSHVLEECQEASQELKIISNKYLGLRSQLTDLLTRVGHVRSQFQDHIDNVLELEKLLHYIQQIAAIEKISNQLTEDHQHGKRQSAIYHYLELVEIWKGIHKTKCTHFSRYLSKTVVYWFEILKEKFGNELDKLLTNLHWPNSLQVNVARPSSDAISKFEMLFSLLLQLDIPSELLSLTNKSFEEELPNQILPLKLMLSPLQKRFVYHFSKSKKTAKLDKPEWYLTQILTWIRDNSEFMEKYVQPILDKSNLKISAQGELMRGLVSVACWKLNGDLPHLLTDDQLLSHTLDEVLLFHRELQVLGYIAVRPSLLSLVISDACLTKWLSLELKFAEERMDQIFNADGAWKYRYPIADELDELRVPQFAEAFMTMLMLMTERYKVLPESQAQLEFLSLQLKLLDDFRLRLQQLRHVESDDPLNLRFAAIINSVHYVLAVLKEWSNLPFFLQLYYTKQCFAVHRTEESSENKELDKLAESVDLDNEDLTGSVFHSVMSLYNHMQNDLLKCLHSWILSDVKAKSRQYRKEKWFSIVASEISELSYSAYPMLKVLKDRLHQAHRVLSLPVCDKLFHGIATDFSQYVYEEVILQNLFSEGGANQLLQDLTRSLIPIFGSYMLRPESYFKELKESCMLLALPKAPVMLLKEVLQNSEQRSYGNEALEEQGIYRLSVTKALQVLKQRNDSCM